MKNWLMMVAKCPWCMMAEEKIIHSRYSSCLCDQKEKIHDSQTHNGLKKGRGAMRGGGSCQFIVTFLFHSWNRIRGRSCFYQRDSSAGIASRSLFVAVNRARGLTVWCGKNRWNRKCVLHSYFMSAVMSVGSMVQLSCRGFVNQRAGRRFNICWIFDSLVVVIVLRMFLCLTVWVHLHWLIIWADPTHQVRY